MDIRIGLIIIILVVFGAILITVNFLIKSLNDHHALNYRLDNLEYEVGELTKKIDIFYRILNEKISKK